MNIFLLYLYFYDDVSVCLESLALGHISIVEDSDELVSNDLFEIIWLNFSGRYRSSLPINFFKIGRLYR